MDNQKQEAAVYSIDVKLLNRDGPRPLPQAGDIEPEWAQMYVWKDGPESPKHTLAIYHDKDGKEIGRLGG